MVYDCINLHFTDYCNYSCKHCFVKKENNELSMDELMVVVDKVKRYFDSNHIKGRINIAGGEPLVSKNIDHLINYIASKGIQVSIITNGYLLDESFIQRHKNHLYSIGLSVDSMDYDTNIKIGRCCKSNILTKDKILHLSKIIKEARILLKINICVSKLNVNENFNELIHIIQPDRLKVFEMVCYDMSQKVNSATKSDIQSFLERLNYNYIYESAESMKKSYIIIDSKGNLSTNNLHLNGASILCHEISDIISTLNVDYENYIKRYI